MQIQDEAVQVKVEAAPTPSEVDALVVSYEEALADVATLADVAAGRKARLVLLVETFGSVPSNAKSSKRLEGSRRQATLTWSTSTTVDEKGVAELKSYLDKKGMPELFEKFFSLMPPPVYVPPPPKHRRVASAIQVITEWTKVRPMARSVGDRLCALYAACVKERTGAPALKLVNLEEKAAKS
jgi:hypothetical protein